jgi:type IV pilus assembly protein PilM
VFGRPRSVTTGLDVGTSSVKVARLAHTGLGVKLIGLAVAEIPRGGGAGAGTPESQRNNRVQAIRRALEQSGAGTSRSVPVVSSIGGPNVSIKEVAFPKMGRQALAESIRWEARRHVPFGTKDFILDFQQMDRGEDDGAEHMHVLLAAVERGPLERHVSLVKGAGVDPYVVDLAPLALMNEAGEEGLVERDPVAVIEIGESVANIAVYAKHGLFFARSVPMPVQWKSHEQPKTVVGAEGVPVPAAETEAVDVNERSLDSPWTKRWLDLVLREARFSLTFYNNETGKHGIGKIYLAGGRALTPDLAGAFRDSLGVETEVLNPLERIGDLGDEFAKMKSQGPRFTLAMGLARRR